MASTAYDRAGQAQPPRSQADGNHEHGVEQRFDHGGPAVGLHDGQHADAGAGVVVAIHPGDGHEVRELPDKENGEQGHGRPLDASAGGGPAEHGAHGAGKGSDEGGQGGDALERRVDGDIGEGREQRQRHGEQIGVEQQPPCAQRQRAEAGQNALRRARCVRWAAAGRRCGSCSASVVRSRAWFSAPAPAETRPMPTSVSSRPRCTLEMPDCIEPR